MLDLSNVSLLCLDTRNPALAEYVMQRCLTGTRFHEAVLLTHADYPGSDPRITVRAVAPLRNIADYSTFMVKELGRHFTGSHVLVIQWDGFIVDPSAWDPAFLDYDYVGAPWPHTVHTVGNGGFSLRSRKLVDALQDPEIRELQPEDYCICDLYHDLLVSRHGIRYAPIALASSFSFEDIPPTGPTFGFHGFFNLHRALTDNEGPDYLEKVTNSAILSVPGRRSVKNLIKAGHYKSAKRILSVRAKTGNMQQRLDAFKLRCRLEFHRLKNLLRGS
jgi:hypothetical protein